VRAAAAPAGRRDNAAVLRAGGSARNAGGAPAAPADQPP